MEEDKKQKHIVLIHGAGHGTWCWYKVAMQLRSQRHQVTALDMAAAGFNTLPLSELSSYSDYSRPLMEFLEALWPEEWVILVGHSMGDQDLTLATLLVRPVGFFGNNVEFSRKNYGSVRRVYMIVEKDEFSKKEFQEWMIQNNPPDEVKTICVVIFF